MEPIARLSRRLRALVQRRRAERELEAELRFHLDMEVEKNVRAGMGPHEARRAALVAFGGVERFKEECRDARRTTPLERVARDLRFALRRLRREPAFTVPAVLTLGVGLGAMAAIFTLVEAVLLRPLPYPGADRLVVVAHTAPGLGTSETGQSEGTYLHYRRHSGSFEEMAVYFDRDLSITDGEAPERIVAALTTPSLFAVLGVRPVLGRLFTVADAESEAPASVLISHGLWQRRFGGDSAIVGKAIELNRSPRRIVGVMPARFEFPRPTTQLWFAMPVDAEGSAGLRQTYMTGVGRLKRGVEPADAERDLRRLVPTLAAAYGDVTGDELRRSGLAPVVRPLKDVIVRDVRQALVALLCTAALVLAIAWANVANLFLVRAERQHRQVSVERALGASTGDLARRFLTESAVVVSIGAGFALALASVAVAARFGFEPGDVPRVQHARLGPSGIALTVGLAVLGAALLGAVSLLRTGRSDVATALKSATARVTGNREWHLVQRTLVAVQVALALTLLVASAVMAQSFWRLRRFELGFDPRNVLTMELALPVRQYLSFQQNSRFYLDLLDSLRRVPGVVAAEAGQSALPLLAPAGFEVGHVAPEAPAGRAEPASRPASVAMATPGYFAAMGIPIVRGRALQPGDLVSDAHPVVLSATLARRLFGNADPVGRRVRLSRYASYPWYTVAGIAGDVPGESIPAGPSATLYFPVVRDLEATPDAKAPVPSYPRELTIVARTAPGVPPTSIVPAVRRVVRQLDPKVPVGAVRTMEQIVEASTARTRLTMLLVLAAAGSALALGVIGIYGVISYAVTQRVPEFGLRIALGATPAAVHRMVLRQGAAVVATGVALGLVAAFGLVEFLRSLLFQVSPRDPLAFAVTPVLLMAVAAVACSLPARRAARVDPAEVLRAE